MATDAASVWRASLACLLRGDESGCVNAQGSTYSVHVPTILSPMTQSVRHAVRLDPFSVATPWTSCFVSTAWLESRMTCTLVFTRRPFPVLDTPTHTPVSISLLLRLQQSPWLRRRCLHYASVENDAILLSKVRRGSHLEMLHFPSELSTPTSPQ